MYFPDIVKATIILVKGYLSFHYMAFTIDKSADVPTNMVVLFLMKNTRCTRNAMNMCISIYFIISSEFNACQM